MEANANHHILARNFTLLSKDELLMILERRNHPEVRKWMAHTAPTTPEEHLRYCASLKNRPEILQLLVEFDGQPACVLSYKATNSSWHEVADCGIYAFASEPCSSSTLSQIVGCKLIAMRGIKVIKIKVKNDNEVALFVNQYYHGYRIVAQDAAFTYMMVNLNEPASFYQAQAEQMLAKLHATLELQL